MEEKKSGDVLSPIDYLVLSWLLEYLHESETRCLRGNWFVRGREELVQD